ncbi:MAG: hypothetical protein P1S46_11820 [bacterium]|nr:hypothetical protein [bacterium]
MSKKKERINKVTLRDKLRGFDIDALDGRTKEAKEIAEARAVILDALGPVSPMKSALVDRAVFLVWKCRIMESRMLQGDPDAYSKDHLRHVEVLRRTLQSLGLESHKTERTLSDVFAEVVAEEDN